jgi:hypothetical protein
MADTFATQCTEILAWLGMFMNKLYTGASVL